MALTVNEDDGHSAPQSSTRRRLYVPGIVNLALGVPAIVPLGLARWLVTEYLPMDCRTVSDLARADHANCNYTTLDHADPVMFLLAVTGVLMLAVVLAVDVILPLRRGRPLGAWIGAAALIPVPFAILLALA